MSHFPHIKYAGLSDVGRKRKNNEDSYGLFPEIGVFCVADGMGGGDDGEVASAATVRAVEMFAKANPLPPKAGFSKDSMVAGLRGAVNSASSWILKRAQEKGLKGCGSTFVGVLFDPCCPDTAIALHAGDSRLYRVRGRSIQQITKDHSAAELIGAKDENEINPMFRGMILRAVGIQKSVEVDATPFQVKQGDRIIICSDGLSKMISDRQIVSIVKESDAVETAVKALVAAANEAGGFDNVTAVVVEVDKMPPALPAVELDVPRFDEVADNSAHADRNTLDTSSETGVSFDLGTATSSTNTSCRTEATGATEQTAITIPEDDSDSAADPGTFEAEIPANPDKTAGEDSAKEVNKKSKSNVGLWIAATAIALVAVAVAVAMIRKPAVVSDSPESVVGKAVETNSIYEARKAEELRQQRIMEERNRQEREAAERLARVEAEERQRKENEAKLAAEQERLRREAELKRAEEERIRREKETERAKEELRLKEEAARRQAEHERMRREKEAEHKRAEEIRIRREAELRKAEEERKRMEEERVRRAKLEKERAEKEKALLEQLTKKKSAALAERRRKAAFEALRRVCEDKSAIAFVRKIKGIADTGSVNDICRMFRPVLAAHTKEEMEKSAVELIRVMKPIVVKLTECAEMYKSDALSELKDPMTSADYKKELKDVPTKMDDFLRNSRRIVGRDAEDFDVHLACAQMIEMVPLWFDAF